MANSPIPDQGQEFIQSGMVLITDPRSDKYLNRSKKKPNDPPADRLSKQGGGEGGFDDYVEQLDT